MRSTSAGHPLQTENRQQRTLHSTSWTPHLDFGSSEVDNISFQNANKRFSPLISSGSPEQGSSSLLWKRSDPDERRQSVLYALQCDALVSGFTSLPPS